MPDESRIWNELGAQRAARSSTTRRGLMQREERTPSRDDTDAAALLDRLQKLRNLLPAFAQEAAAARREAARLRLQNTKLQARLTELEAPRQHDITTNDRR